MIGIYYHSRPYTEAVRRFPAHWHCMACQAIGECAIEVEAGRIVNPATRERCAACGRVSTVKRADAGGGRVTMTSGLEPLGSAPIARA